MYTNTMKNKNHQWSILYYTAQREHAPIICGHRLSANCADSYEGFTVTPCRDSLRPTYWEHGAFASGWCSNKDNAISRIAELKVRLPVWEGIEGVIFGRRNRRSGG